ncbi:restriction endonuclease subunit S [Paenibacillus hexagrammi]|uniref:Restriction endonuclease subunit S n=1 Tax=Paenibacillus hexagrammi TaxID=2908839 RepID=A0ABY3SDM2_9BACL|nr:restriction endonuclease subunit S [Paenibacillus sp. YPD9-1]UJF32092.1 restriction endonuclease subunit S [Paenibacillus sp. YPD9-1]
MDRHESYLSILDATAKIQHNVALILEAKALHAEKSRNWICHHLATSAYESNADHIKQATDIHEQLIAVIDGITKMEVAFAKNLNVLISEEEDASGGGLGGGFGDLFGGLGGGLGGLGK